jgi:hypothetical protein
LSNKITQGQGLFQRLDNYGEKHEIMMKKDIDTPLLVIYDERNHWKGGDQKNAYDKRLQ